MIKRIKLYFLTRKYAKKITGVIVNANNLDPNFSAILINNLYDDYHIKKQEIKEK